MRYSKSPGIMSFRMNCFPSCLNYDIVRCSILWPWTRELSEERVNLRRAVYTPKPSSSTSLGKHFIKDIALVQRRLEM
jgi:hypothetical protein